ncbi:MAG: hypothetical protein ACKO0N_12675, partial [Planctomycetota bacterium]
ALSNCDISYRAASWTIRRPPPLVAEEVAIGPKSTIAADRRLLDQVERKGQSGNLAAQVASQQFFLFSLTNGGDQRLATKGLSTPPDFIASPLHRFVRHQRSMS